MRAGQFEGINTISTRNFSLAGADRPPRASRGGPEGFRHGLVHPGNSSIPPRLLLDRVENYFHGRCRYGGVLTRISGIGKRGVNVLFIPMPGGWYARYLESGGIPSPRQPPWAGHRSRCQAVTLPPAPSLPPA